MERISWAGSLSARQSWMVDIFRPPRSSAWDSGLGISGSLSSSMSCMGSAGLGPDHLQVFRCSKEAEPLRGHPASQSLWTC